MIIFVEKGRLGNQIFQYLAIFNVYKNHKIIFFGFSQLLNLVEHPNNCVFIKLMNKKAIELIRIFLRAIAKSKIFISYHYESIENGRSQIIERKGILFPGIIFLDESYFQSIKYIDNEIISNLKIKKRHIQKANNIIKIRDDKFEKNHFYFIHIRRGDYLTWPKSSPAVLPGEWYGAVERLILQYDPNTFFLVFSDDKQYIKNVYIDEDKYLIIEAGEEVEFALMTLCDGGILSASSFSLAASLVGIRGEKKHYYGPLHWLGHKRCTWSPSIDIIFPQIKYIDVNIPIL